MKDLNERQLLAEYARNGSEEAFRELVQRNVQLVYGTALRIVRDSQMAEDLTQEVFLVLARKAAALAQHPTLCAWLHLTARNLAAKSVRGEVRRRAREQEVMVMDETQNADASADWKELAPRLDELLGNLSEPDREALLLRFFQNKSAREMAEMLDLSAEAAQKRVSRAVDRLRSLFESQGVVIGVGGLAAVLEAHAVYAVPPNLTPTIVASVAGMSGGAEAQVHVRAEGGAFGWKIAALAGVLMTLAVIFVFNRARLAGRNAEPPVMAAAAQPWPQQAIGIPLLLGEQATAEAIAAAIAVAVPVRFFPEEVWKRAGFGTPEETLITFMWAKKRGDLKTMALTSTPQLSQALEELYFRNKSDGEVAAMMMKSAERQFGFEILSKRIAGQEMAILEVYFDDDAPGDFSILVFKKLGDEWRIAGVEERSGGHGENAR